MVISIRPCSVRAAGIYIQPSQAPPSAEERAEHRMRPMQYVLCNRIHYMIEYSIRNTPPMVTSFGIYTQNGLLSAMRPIIECCPNCSS
jgi:hypothetical protein